MKKILLIFFWSMGVIYSINAQNCDNCSAPNCSVAPITDQINVFYNVDGFAPDLGCSPAEVRAVTNGSTVTFCAEYTTPATLEESAISFLGSIPTANIGCDASVIGNWTITNSCGVVSPLPAMTQEPNLPSFTQRPIWPVSPSTTYELCYDVTVSGSCTQVSNPCIAPHWVPIICELQVNTANHDCSDNDGNYDVTISFTGGGQGVGTYTLNTNAGTIAGDDPNTTVAGNILIENIPDGGSYDFTIVGNGSTSGCDYTISNSGYTCASCPKITSATVENDNCEGNTVTLTATVDAGVEGVDYYIEWYMNGNAINSAGSSSTGLDGVYGNADDPVTALTYTHTLAFDGSVGACSFEEQVFTAKLYCITIETLDQGDVNNATTGGTIAASYVFGTETCVTLDLSSLPAGAVADYFQYKFRVTSGPPFGNSWICEAVMNVKTPSTSEGPFCHDYWNGACPDFNPSNQFVTCGGSSTGAGTNLVPNSGFGLYDFGGINSTTTAQGLWEVCVYDSYNDQNGGIEGVMNYVFLEIHYYLPPGVDINTTDGSIVDAVNISFPAPIPTTPVTVASHPSGAGNVTGLRVCNAPVAGADFTLPNAANCEAEITLNCSDALLRYSGDGGITYYLTSVPQIYITNQEVHYKISSIHCPTACGTIGSYILANCPVPCSDPNLYADNCDLDGDGINNIDDLDDDNDGILDMEECPPVQTGIWTIINPNGTHAETALGNGVTVMMDVTNSTFPITNGQFNPAGDDNPSQLFWEPADVAGDPSLQMVYLWGEVVTFSFVETLNPSNPVMITNPIIHFDRIGGHDNNVANASLITLLGGLTWTELAGTLDFTTTATTATDQSVYSGGGINNSESNWNIAGGTASGTMRINGTVSSFSMDMIQNGPPGIGDGVEVILEAQYILGAFCDADGDGISNQFDLDSDADGCSDAFEAGATIDDTDDFQFSDISGTDANGISPTVDPNDDGNLNYTSTYSEATDSLINNCPVNQAPDITNNNSNASTTTTYLEDDIIIVDNYEATDFEGETEGAGLTWSLSGGIDQADFSIDPNNGELTFVNPPDYQNPDDDDLDNFYLVDIAVTDSEGAADTQSLTIGIIKLIEICDNGIDDDNDGDIDCDDSECTTGNNAPDSDGDLIPDCIEDCTGDRDGDGISNCADIDPMGYFYYEHTGEIITGVSYTVINTATNNDNDVTYIKDGSTGEYQWIISAPGTYQMVLTLPAGYTNSNNCLASDPPAYDPTGQPDPNSIGNGQNGSTGFLTSNACTPYYLTFDLEVSDPFVINNNIPLLPTTEISCTDGIDNDEDGDIDCADLDCDAAPDCCTPPVLTISGN